ncbi:DDE domain-containing protein [Ruegeria halocynthiae]|uniref:DDE domain-containing protein n=1 Tax=Ruegeria halocynthiae TaxID=985054 RepID=A0A1H3F615_9RHOB|nr:DDE domain-containing protein [Ruegeria halocynthiae]
MNVSFADLLHSCFIVAYGLINFALDEVFVKINGEARNLWRAVDHECEVLESFVKKRGDRKAALKFLRKAMRRYGQPDIVLTDRLRCYDAAMKGIGNAQRRITLENPMSITPYLPDQIRRGNVFTWVNS